MGLLGVHFYGESLQSDIGVQELGTVVSAVALVVLGTAVLLLFFPETNQRELEAISYAG